MYAHTLQSGRCSAAEERLRTVSHAFVAVVVERNRFCYSKPSETKQRYDASPDLGLSRVRVRKNCIAVQQWRSRRRQMRRHNDTTITTLISQSISRFRSSDLRHGRGTHGSSCVHDHGRCILNIHNTCSVSSIWFDWLNVGSYLRTWYKCIVYIVETRRFCQAHSTFIHEKNFF